jgi:hypothetical protein
MAGRGPRRQGHEGRVLGLEYLAPSSALAQTDKPGPASVPFSLRSLEGKDSWWPNMLLLGPWFIDGISKKWHSEDRDTSPAFSCEELALGCVKLPIYLYEKGGQ